MHVTPPAGLAQELAEIGERLAALASSEDGRSSMAAELGAIRAQLRSLASENDEIALRLGELLGLRTDEPAPPH